MDVAVAVADWAAYDRLTSSLRRSGRVRHQFVVHLPGGLRVRVASPAAQSAPKILAWRGRRHEGDQDAIDVGTILRAYSEGAYLEELYEHDAVLLERFEFDPLLAGAARLGAEAAVLLDPASRQVLRSELGREGALDRRADGG